MSRQQGIFTFTKNFEVRNAAPLDARMRIPYYSGLTDNSTIPYPYNGMLVSVISDSNSARNGLYFLQDKGTSTTASTTASTWSIVGGTSITGGTLNLTGGTIDFSGATTGFTVNNINFVTGFTVTNNAISGNTNTGTAYGGVFTAITGGSYSDGTISLSGSGDFSNTIPGFNVLSGTGIDSSYNTTYNTKGILLDPVNQILQLQLNNGTFISANTAAFTSDNYVYSGSYDSNTGIVTFLPISGGSFEVSGWPTNLANYYTTGSTYSASTGIISFNRTDTQPAYSATGFNYITGFTIYSDNTLSGITNTGQTINGGTINAVTGGTLVGDTLYFSGTGNFLPSISGFGTLQNAEFLTGATVYSNNTISGITNSGNSVNFGQVNAVTGGTLVGDTLYFSGTGDILSGITGFGTGSAVVTGGTNNFITKWSGTSALTISQIYDDGSNVGIGITGAGLTNKLTVSASTDPVKLIGVQQSSSPIPSTKFLAWDNSTGVVSWNNVTEQTGITIYVTGFTSSTFTNGLNPVVDFIPSGTTENYRGASYQYLITANNFPTTRMGTLQGLWTSGASPFVSYSDVGPTQITDGVNTIINSLYFSAVTGGIRVVVNCGGGNYTFKAYKVLL
jgi:hypothetical protein